MNVVANAIDLVLDAYVRLYWPFSDRARYRSQTGDRVKAQRVASERALRRGAPITFAPQ